jgi:hypothetical protein
MNLWGYGAIALLAAGTLLVTSGTQREKSLVAGAPDMLRLLEARAAAQPNDPGATGGLAQAYLDARQSGLALVLVESAPPAVRADVRVRHVYARALVDQGRDDDALAVERSVVVACRASDDVQIEAPGCDAVLLASAERRAAILEELVSLGVEDAQSQPDMSLVAYKNATREARIASE